MLIGLNTLPPATSLVGPGEATSSRNLTVKRTSCQKSQFWVMRSGLTFSINSGHRGMNLPFDGFHPRWRLMKHYNLCTTVPRYPFYVCVLPASPCQATLTPLESYLCQLHQNRLCFICAQCLVWLAPWAICIMKLVPRAWSLLESSSPTPSSIAATSHRAS